MNAKELRIFIRDVETNASINKVWSEPVTDNEIELVILAIQGNDIATLKRWAIHLLCVAVANREER